MGRQVYYVQPDGSHVDNRSDGAIIATPASVVAAARQYSAFSPKHFLATAQHETDLALNEEDVETTGYTTTGIYQLNWSDEIEAIAPFANVLLLDDATRVFASKVEERALLLQHAANAAANDPTNPRGLAWPDLHNPPPDAYGYLSVAHNQGIGAALKTIAQYGMDWNGDQGYRARNIGVKTDTFDGAKVCAYGDDCISGGKYWDDSLDVSPSADGDATGGGDAAGAGDPQLLQRLVVLAVVLFLGWQLIGPRLV